MDAKRWHQAALAKLGALRSLTFKGVGPAGLSRSSAHMTPEELTAELILQLERVGVDLRVAHPRMHEVVPPVERENVDGTLDVQITIDASGILRTLQQLGDGAGTNAFVAAYNARHRDATAGS